jgi:hypothetical protein
MAARAEFLAGLSARLRQPGTVRIVALSAVAVVALAVAAWRLGVFPVSKPEEPTTTRRTVASVRHARTAVPVPGTVYGPMTEAEALAAATAKPAPAKGAQLASTAVPVEATVTAVTPEAEPAPEPTVAEDHVVYQYNALGRRDPFQSLLGGEFVGIDQGGDVPPDPGGIQVVGIVWGVTDRFAMVEDVRGNSYVLRRGDKVQNGVVEELRQDAVVIGISADGQSQKVVIPLQRKGDSNVR